MFPGLSSVALTYKRVGTTRTLTGLPGGSFGLERADSTTLFTLGSFRVSTNLRPPALPATGYETAPVGIVAQSVSLASLQVESLLEARAAHRFQQQLRLPVDPADLQAYGHYGSIRLRLRAAVRAAIAAFPAGLVAEATQADGRVVSTIIAHSYDADLAQTTLVLATDTLRNPFNLNLHALAAETRAGQPDLLRAPERYVLLVLGEPREYPLVHVEGLTQAQTGLLTLVVAGELLTDYSDQTLGISLLVRPSSAFARAQFRAATPELGIYLLGGAHAPLPSDEPVIFRLPLPGENYETSEPVIEEIPVSWPRTDGYNLAVDGPGYASFLGQLEFYGEALDEFKSDLLVTRYAPPDSLLALDQTEQGKMSALLRVWGRQLDDTRQFIDALVRVHHLDYDPNLGLPDQLVRNLASTLGWRVSTLLDEDQLLDRLYATGTPATSASVLPADLDAELWRRIALNTQWFMQAKGTRRAIESMLALLGIPNGLLEFSEHVYVFEPSLAVAATPALPAGVGYGEQVDTTPVRPPVYHNRGQDGNYLAPYRATGNLRQVTDNRKVWVAPSADEQLSGYWHQDADRATNYEVPAGARVLPSKEISLTISPSNGWNTDFYTYCLGHGFPVAPDLNADTLRVFGDFTPTSSSIAEFMEQTLAHFINARTHKTTVDYPTLRGLLHAYRQQHPEARSVRELLAYTKRLNRYWRKLILQLVPATAIFTGEGLSIGTTFLQNSKFRYRQGISAGSEFRDSLRQPYTAAFYIGELTGEVLEPYESTVYGFEFVGSVRTSQQALLSPARRLRPRPRLQARSFTLNYPLASATSIALLLPEQSVDVTVPYVSGTTQSKRFTLETLASSVLPTESEPNGPFQLGYAVYEARVGQPLQLRQTVWVDPGAYVPVTAPLPPSLPSATRGAQVLVAGAGARVQVQCELPATLLKPDSEYVVKTYFGKRIWRGGAAELPTGPFDLTDTFRFQTYRQQQAGKPGYTDPLAPGYALELTNEAALSLPGTYFNAYRARTDFYFPTVALPASPTYQAPSGVRAVGLYDERLVSASSGSVVNVTLAFRALSEPQLLLSGVLLTKGSDYEPVYSVGHPLAYQAYRLLRSLPATATLVARYRTGQQPLNLRVESYTLPTGPSGYVDLAAGQQPGATQTMYLVGPVGTTAKATAYVLGQTAIAGSVSLRVDGKLSDLVLSETYTLPNGQQLRAPGTLFSVNPTGTEPSRTSRYELTYGVLDTTRLDTQVLTTPSWLVNWSWSDRYAAETLTRVQHTFVIEAAQATDFEFSGVVTTLGQVALPSATVSTASQLVDLTKFSASLLPGHTYLVRLRAVKHVNLVNQTQLTYEASSALYRLAIPLAA
jgi:hypothetical protein